MPLASWTAVIALKEIESFSVMQNDPHELDVA